MSDERPAPDCAGIEAALAALQGVLAAGLREVRADLAGLRQAFDDKVRYDTGQQQIIDRLHAEVQEQRNDMVLKLLRPVALDLIKLHDDLARVRPAGLLGAEPHLAQQVEELLEGFRASVEEVLARAGFEAFQTDSPLFDGTCQRVVRTVATPDRALDRTIAERLLKGFRYGAKVVRPEAVSVYSCVPTA